MQISAAVQDADGMQKYPQLLSEAVDPGRVMEHEGESSAHEETKGRTRAGEFALHQEVFARREQDLSGVLSHD
jgi:hypothetical protein